MKNRIKYISFIVLFIVMILSVGYSSFNSSLSINDITSTVRVASDIRVTGVSIDSSLNGGLSNYEEYNINSISSSIKLPNYNSSVTYKVDITNFESLEMGIYNITGLPDNLMYEISSSNYVLKDKICDSNNKCNMGISKELLITIKYKSISAYDRNNTLFNFKLNFDFRPFYNITYNNVDSSNYPTEIISGDTLSINIDDEALDSVDVKINNNSYDNYILNGTNLSISNITGDLSINVKYLEKPSIIDKLVPVKYNGSNWIVTTSDDPEWHDYDNQKWANAVILNDGVSSSKDTVIYLDETNCNIKGMFVWIPRYSYTIWKDYGVQLEGGETPSKATPGAIDIKFSTTKLVESGKAVYTGDDFNGWLTHPAFWWDNNSNGEREAGEELSGIWVGKFETTGSAELPTVLPGRVSLMNQIISLQFATSKVFNTYLNNTKIDAHMAKNTEWGVVAYLSQSKYGKYGNSNYIGLNKEIMYNNCTNYITGIAANSYDETHNVDVCTTNTYDSVQGQTASTTGNIYGIYDMSGGAWEYTMGYLETASTTWGATSEKDYARFTEKPDSKYYDSYSSTSIYSGCNGGRCYGQGFHETAKWYGDAYNYLKLDKPWLSRGGNIEQPGTAGIFYLASNMGNASKRTSFRTILSVID